MGGGALFAASLRPCWRPPSQNRAPPHTRTTTAGTVIGYPDGGVEAGGRTARLRVLSVGSAVLGVTYGMGGRSVGVVEGEAALASAAADAVAAPGLFSKRVPVVADVRLLPAGELPAPAAVEQLAARSATAFGPPGEVAGLLAAGGRRCLRDYDVVDALPPRRRGEGARAPVAAAALEPRLLALAAALPGAELVCPLPLDSPTGLTFASGLAFRQPRASVFHPSGGNSGGGGGSGGVGGASGLALGAHAVAAPWRAVRVRTLTGAEAEALVAELTRKTRRRASFVGRSATFGDAAGWEEDLDAESEGGGGGGGSEGEGGGRKPAGGGAAPQPFAFWFELAPRAGAGGSCGGVTTLLRVAPVAALRAVAPPGAHTWPYAPGMDVEVRRLGGPWAAATVEAADRLLLRVRLASPLAPPPGGGAAAPKLPAAGLAVRVDAGGGAWRSGGGGGAISRWGAWWGGGTARAAAAAEAAVAAERAREEAAAAPPPAPLPAGATLLAVVGVPPERGEGGPLPCEGEELPLPVPLGGGADGAVEEGCEVVPAQLWGFAVRRAGDTAAKGAAAALLAAARRAAGAQKQLVGLAVPL